MKEIRLEDIRFCQQVMSLVKKVYYNSFPIEERRAWGNIESLLVSEDSPYNIDAIFHEGQFIGFISWWAFADFCYVEHFAIDSLNRERGMGTRAVSQFIKDKKKLIVLEVELPGRDEMARRRIAFYMRNGFVAHDNFEYIQPSYGDGLPQVPMMLMTAGVLANVDLEFISQQLHEVVYGVK